MESAAFAGYVQNSNTGQWAESTTSSQPGPLDQLRKRAESIANQAEVSRDQVLCSVANLIGHHPVPMQGNNAKAEQGPAASPSFAECMSITLDRIEQSLFSIQQDASRLK